MSAGDVAEIGGPIVLLGSLAAYWISALRGAARHERAVRRVHARAKRARYVAIEAAEDDPLFAPDAIADGVAEIVMFAEVLWQHIQVKDLDLRPDAPLIRAWARMWQSRLGSALSCTHSPSVELLSVVNRQREEEDRAVLRVRARLRSQGKKVGNWGTSRARTDERWTLGRSGPRWVLLSVSGDPLAGPILTAPLIACPSWDTLRLQEESLAELAMAQKLDDDVILKDLVSPDAPPAFALVDLSLVDSRFTPALLAAELQHLLEAWEEAASSSDEPIEDLTNAETRSGLLRPRSGARLVVRDTVLKSWETTGLNLHRHPPSVEVKLDVVAVRYVVGNDGKVQSGSTKQRCPMSLRWTLELNDSTRAPWRLISTNSPAEDIPGWV